MISVIHWKFANQKNVEASFRRIVFNQPGLTVLQLKRKIVEQVNTPPDRAFDLEIKNLVTGEVYGDNQRMVPRNTTLEVRLIPSTASRAKIILEREKDPNIIAMKSSKDEGVLRLEKAVGPALFTNRLAPEMREAERKRKVNDEMQKILQMQLECGQDEVRLTAERKAARRGGGGFRGGGGGGVGGRPPPFFRAERPGPHYRCHRCGIKGHWIQECPKNSDPTFSGKRYQYSATSAAGESSTSTEEIKDTLRISLPGFGFVDVPKELAHSLSADDLVVWYRSQKRGAAATSSSAQLPRTAAGMGTVPTIDFALPPDSKPVVAVSVVPPYLGCPICQGICKEASMTPCCKTTFCLECITKHVFTKSFKCFVCKSEVDPDSIEPNNAIRQAVIVYKNKEELRKKQREQESAVLAKARRLTEGVPPALEAPVSASTARVKGPSVTVTRKALKDESGENTVDESGTFESASMDTLSSAGKTVAAGVMSMFPPSVAASVKIMKTTSKPTDSEMSSVSATVPIQLDVQCLSCGQMGHRFKECPQRLAAAGPLKREAPVAVTCITEVSATATDTSSSVTTSTSEDTTTTPTQTDSMNPAAAVALAAQMPSVLPSAAGINPLLIQSPRFNPLLIGQAPILSGALPFVYPNLAFSNAMIPQFAAGQQMHERMSGGRRYDRSRDRDRDGHSREYRREYDRDGRRHKRDRSRDRYERHKREDRHRYEKQRSHSRSRSSRRKRRSHSRSRSRSSREHRH